MYKLKLFLKYIKYCIRKKPLIVTTLTYDKSEHLDDILTLPNKFYTLVAPNGKNVIAIFNKHHQYDFNHVYKKYWNYNWEYKWTFLGYENQTLLHDCKWKEFKTIYFSFFYPHLASTDEVTSKYVADLLNPNEETPKSIFIIRQV